MSNCFRHSQTLTACRLGGYSQRPDPILTWRALWLNHRSNSSSLSRCQRATKRSRLLELAMYWLHMLTYSWSPMKEKQGCQAFIFTKGSLATGKWFWERPKQSSDHLMLSASVELLCPPQPSELYLKLWQKIADLLLRRSKRKRNNASCDIFNGTRLSNNSEYSATRVGDHSVVARYSDQYGDCSV